MNEQDMMMQALSKAYIDGSSGQADSIHAPKLLKNDRESKETVLAAVLRDLEDCQTFDISTAFVTKAGLALLKTTLSDLADKGISGRLVTSTYLGFNNPLVFRELLKIPNLEVRVSNLEGFHVKGYFFKKKDYNSYIIGSSNLTDTALKTNFEWNFRFTSKVNGNTSKELEKEFENLFNSSNELTDSWLKEYEKNYVWPKFNSVSNQVPRELEKLEITPNSMQEKALDNLELLRQDGKEKAFLISATGTGKTYLSALDVAQAKPDKVLFIVHREQILLDAMESFRNVLGGFASDYGFYTGTQKDLSSKYIFATVQSLSKEENLSSFAIDHFDYILIDEIHKAGAKSYLDILDYFKPKFLLGMTATPERTDDFNIFQLFDYNIAYEIRLQDAMDEDLLVPFHYYGVTDFEKDGDFIDDTISLSRLISEERVDYLLDKISYYGVSGDKVRGLVFCSSVDESRAMSEIFNERGYKTSCLSGSDSILERERQIELLEAGQLDYIFTRDIFNEGIDIPSVNQIVMLRNTESNIVFIQQLGRGLRKHQSKDYTVIIDFIGNYKNNYLIPQALTGDNTSSKDSLRRDLFATNYLSGLSSINFEAIAKEKIYESINSVKLDLVKFLRDSYDRLKNRLGKIPKLLDFEKFAEVDPFILATKFDTYPSLLRKIEPDYDGKLDEDEFIMLRFFGRELLKGKSKGELLLLEYLMGKENISKDNFFALCRDSDVLMDEETFITLIKVLNMTFWTSIYKKVYSVPFIKYDEKSQLISKSDALISALQNPDFVENLRDYLATAKVKNHNFDNRQAMTQGQKYEKRDVTRFLNFDHQEVDLAIAGYKIRPDRKKMMIFLTMTKTEESTSTQIKYVNKFIGKSKVSWYSKRKRNLKSPEIKALLDYENNGMEVYVFIKKSDTEKESDSYFVGRARPILETIRECKIDKHDGSQEDVVETYFEFIDTIDDDLYGYLLG